MSLNSLKGSSQDEEYLWFLWRFQIQYLFLERHSVEQAQLQDSRQSTLRHNQKFGAVFYSPTKFKAQTVDWDLEAYGDKVQNL
jgi:hypothetical protein